MGERNPKVGYTIRIVAGAYVIYLAIKGLRMVLNGESGIPFVGAVAMAVVLTLFGVAFVINGLKGYKYLKEHPEDPEESEEDEAEGSDEEEAVQEEPVKPAASSSSILSKASIPEHLRVSDEEDDSEEEETE